MNNEKFDMLLGNTFQIGQIVWQNNLQLKEEADNLFLTKNKPFIYRTTTKERDKIKEVYLHLQNSAHEWEFIKLKRNHEGEFYAELNYVNCGMYFFRLLYKLVDDEKIYWDARNYTKCLVEPEGVNDLSIYTYLPNVSGKIKDWLKDFANIKRMGFNTIHLLPLTQAGASQSPYAAKELMHIDKNYIHTNEDDEIFELVDFCKKEKIKLCIDIVFNHVSVDSYLCEKFPHWLQADPEEEDGFKRAGCWHENQWLKWRDLALIYFEHPHLEIRNEIWSYMLSYGLYWAEIANMTNGMIRLDNLHSTPFAFIDHALTEIRKTFPDLLVQAELFTNEENIHKYTAKGLINMLFATPWLNPYAENFRQQILYLHDKSKHMKFIFPANSHDSGSIAEMYGEPESVIPRYASVALMSCGQTGLVQGAEANIYKKLNFIGYQERIELPNNIKIEKSIQLINLIKSKYDVFQTSQNIRFIDQNNSAVLACLRTSENSTNSSEFLVITNFNTQGQQTVNLDLQGYEEKEAFEHVTSTSLKLDSLKYFLIPPLSIMILEIK